MATRITQIIDLDEESIIRKGYGQTTNLVMEIGEGLNLLILCVHDMIALRRLEVALEQIKEELLK